MSADFIDYTLPPERIAQEPPARREASRLLVLDSARGQCAHHHMHEFVQFLREGDVLVVNDTRVIPARLRAHRATGGAVEILLLEERDDDPGVWSALLRPGKAAHLRGFGISVLGLLRSISKQVFERNRTKFYIITTGDPRQAATAPPFDLARRNT